MDPVETLYRRTLALADERRSRPASTYRLQFHKGFTFRDATAIVPYLAALGVTHAYASPYLKAKPGSTHGYDVIDHCALNPEVGTDADYAAFLDALAKHGMSHVLDTVPNHVGVATNENVWWNDVLENGRASKYGAYFDITWEGSSRPQLHGKVLLPVLGEPYGEVLEKGQLQLKFEAGAFGVYYHDRRFPISPRSYGDILTYRRDALESSLDEDSPAMEEYRQLLVMIDHLPDSASSDAAAADERHRDKEFIKSRLAHLAAESEPVRAFIGRNVAAFNGKVGDPRSFDRLDALLNRQNYRLAYWKVAPDEINYRRFFDINDLAALSQEHREVFEATHGFTLGLVAEGKVAGIRIDHPDGLYDPRQYLHRLQSQYLLELAKQAFAAEAASPAGDWQAMEPALCQRFESLDLLRHDRLPLYVTVEKILEADEPLSDDWLVDGTTGYDFLSKANGLFVDGANEGAFTDLYRQFTDDATDFDDLVYRKKLLILDTSLASELTMLAHQLDCLAQRNRRTRDFTLSVLRETLRQVIACFPVYRAYVADGEVHETDRRYVDVAIERALKRNPAASPAVYDFLRDTLLLKYPDGATEEDRAAQRRFAGKFQQVTAPVTAKGIEDTSFYVYQRFVSLNEVGGDPGRFGTPPEEMHRYLQDRQAKWRYGLSPLSTHDTKRSEDVRARLNVLSEMPREWGERIAAWAKANEKHQTRVGDAVVPNRNEEYLIYQTILGAYPLGDHDESFVERIQAYMLKAIREAKLSTSWTAPNEPHEKAVQAFVASILDRQRGAEFLADFLPFCRRVGRLGLLNSLSQTLLRLTAPGVPDTYQGTELWDLSLVDPDNRRPVDYERRRTMLGQLTAQPPQPEQMLQSLEDGRLKLFVTSRALHARRAQPELFGDGSYEPIIATGPQADRVFAFARLHEGAAAVVIVPRLVAGLADKPWEGTSIRLPRGIEGTFRNLFTGDSVKFAAGENPLAPVLSKLPFGLFTSGE